MAKFRTRARALDMLGRQQIAGRPTAISELFKNAHDAYARRVEVDFFRSNRLFVLRDNGTGMTASDFTERWLTLGTESKLLGQSGSEALRPPPGEKVRPMMGEKGIGRLAIASIGRLVLVLTRALRGTKRHDLVAALIHWGIFEAPGIDLDQIEIPVRTFPGGSLPTAADVRRLVDDAKKNILLLSNVVTPVTVTRISEELEAFAPLNPASIEKALAAQDAKADVDRLGSLSLEGSGVGTHFFIRPADALLIDEVEESDGAGGDATPLEKMLVGFTHAMRAGVSAPRIKTSFRYHRRDDAAPDVIVGDGAFFSRSEFDSADHTFVGEVDSHGAFKGRVRIFDQCLDYSLPSPLEQDAETRCGPFSIGFAYLQGDQKQSRLYHKSPDAYAQLNGRLQKFGGVYVYRDGIRVLPYGKEDFDFLGVETRRNKGAAYYFFAYRRMFGSIDLSRERNGDLQEKAGREGFRDNAAYHQLKKICINLLVQLAAEFFRAKSPQLDIYEKQREQFVELELVRRRREAMAKERRSEFDKTLTDILARINDDRARSDADVLVARAKKAFGSLALEGTADNAGKLVLRAKSDLLTDLETLRTQYRVIKPRGIGLTQRLRRDYAAYVAEIEVVEREVFGPAERAIKTTADEVAKAAKVAVSRREWARAALDDVVSKTMKAVRSERASLDQITNTLTAGVTELVKGCLSETDKAISAAVARVERLDMGALTETQLERERSEAERLVAEEGRHRVDLLARAREVVGWAANSIKDGTIASPEDITGALEEELLAHREREAAEIELTQLGTAIEVINHEFTSTIKSVRTHLRTLGAWAKANEEIRPLQEGLRTAFDNLDGYLSLFTPLHRRLYRKRIQIRGGAVATYLDDLFRERFARHAIRFEPTPAFKKHTFKGFPSSFYPVFVNLIDNSIFWLGERRSERTVTLDAAGGCMFVSDTGPGIAKRDREEIFERGFSRKPGGRGLGLYIAREVLRREGYSLGLAKESRGGARFVIGPLSAPTPKED